MLKLSPVITVLLKGLAWGWFITFLCHLELTKKFMWNPLDWSFGAWNVFIFGSSIGVAAYGISEVCRK